MTLDDIRRVKRFYENFAVTLGIVIGMILIIYFYTFSEFADHAPRVLWFQGVTTVLMVFVLIYIKRVSFAATKLWLGNRERFKPIFVGRTGRDLEKNEDQLLAELQR